MEDYERRFDDMMSVFRRQALMDMARDEEIDERTAEQLIDAVIESLMDVFEIRGRGDRHTDFRRDSNE